MTRRINVLSVLLAAVLFVVSGQAEAQFRIIAGPIQNRTYTDKAVICFEASSPSTYILQWGVLGGAKDQTASGSTVVSSDSREPTYYWSRVEITGLSPDTVYTYDLSVSETAGAGTASFTSGRFRTAPSTTRAFTFAVFGDSRGDPSQGTTGANWNNVSARMDSDPAIEFTIGTGDFIGEAPQVQQWEEQFFGPGKTFLARTPFHQAIGNHDYITGSSPRVPQFYRDIFDTPGAMWYTFTYGPARFICLDTGAPSSTQRAWVQQVLAAATEQYIFIASHYPAFSMGAHGKLRADGLPQEYHVRLFLQNIVPMMEQYNVTAVFPSHDHFYERSLKNGVHHILSGGGGCGLRDQEDFSGNASPPQQNPYLVTWAKKHHYCRVSVNSSRALLETIDVNGNVIDTVTMAPRFQVDQTPPTIAAWVSSATHGRGVGEVLLVIPDDGSFSEPRSGGISKLKVIFSEAMDPLNFTSTNVEIAGLDANGESVNLSGVVIATTLTTSDLVGEITFTPALPDYAKYIVRIVGATDVAGNAVAGDNDRIITALIGDASGDLRVNTADLSVIRGARTKRISSGSVDQIRADISLDGRVNVSDMSLIRASNGNDATAIADPTLP